MGNRFVEFIVSFYIISATHAIFRYQGQPLSAIARDLNDRYGAV